MMNKMINELFEDKNIEMIFDEEKGLLFEIYSTGMALGYVKSNTIKGKTYYQCRKDRVDKTIENAEISTLVHAGLIYMTEEQLYDFMLEARTDKCKEFRRWVTKELLPKLRKQGYYIDEDINQEQLDKLQSQVDKLKNKLREERTKKVYGSTEIVELINVEGLLSSSLLRYMNELGLGCYKVAKVNRVFKYNDSFVSRCCAKGYARVGVGGKVEFYKEFADSINNCETALKRLRQINQEELEIRNKGVEKRVPF